MKEGNFMVFLKKAKKEGNSFQRQSLIDDIEQTKSDLESAYLNFQNVVDPDLIDCYIFEVNAAQKRYKFLMECMRKMNEEMA